MRRALGAILLLATACSQHTTKTPTPVITAPTAAAPSPVPVSDHACLQPLCHIGEPTPAPTRTPKRRAARSRSTPVHKAVHGVIMHVTGYCTGQITSSGKQVSPGMVAVLDRSIPMGISVHIEGQTTSVGYWDNSYVVEDHIGHGSQVDIFFDSCAFARKFGKQYLHVTFSH